MRCVATLLLVLELWCKDLAVDDSLSKIELVGSILLACCLSTTFFGLSLECSICRILAILTCHYPSGFFLLGFGFCLWPLNALRGGLRLCNLIENGLHRVGMAALLHLLLLWQRYRLWLRAENIATERLLFRALLRFVAYSLYDNADYGDDSHYYARKNILHSYIISLFSMRLTLSKPFS